MELAHSTAADLRYVKYRWTRLQQHLEDRKLTSDGTLWASGEDVQGSTELRARHCERCECIERSRMSSAAWRYV